MVAYWSSKTVENFKLSGQKGVAIAYERLRGRLLTTMLLLWEIPYHHILETLTSTDKLLGHICSMGKVFKIFESQPYLAGHLT